MQRAQVTHIQQAIEPIDRNKANTPPPFQSWLDVRLMEIEIDKAETNVMELVSILNNLSLFKWGSNQILGTELESKYANLADCMRELFKLLRGLRSVAMADFLVLDENGMIQKDLSGAIKIHKQIDCVMISQLSSSLQSLVDRCINSKKAQKNYQNTLRLLAEISQFKNKLSRSIDDATLIATQRHYQALVLKKETEKAALEKEYAEVNKRFSQHLAATETGNDALKIQNVQLSTLVEEQTQKRTALERENSELRLQNVSLAEKNTRQDAALNIANAEIQALKTELSKPIPEKKRMPSWRQVLVGGLAVFGAILFGASLALSLTGMGAVIGIPGMALSIGIIAGATAMTGAGVLTVFNLISARKEDRRHAAAVDAFRHQRENVKRSNSHSKIHDALNINPAPSRRNSAAPRPVTARRPSFLATLNSSHSDREPLFIGGETPKQRNSFRG